MDSQFITNNARVQHRKQTEQIVTLALKKHGRAHWLGLLHDKGIPCTAVHSLGEMAAHPHTEASGMLLHYEHPYFGAMNGVAQPLRFNGERCAQRLVPPLCGEHSVQVLQELGYSLAKIDALLEEGVISTSSATAVAL